MEACNSCNKTFSYQQIFKSFWIGYRPIECSSCNTKYVHTYKNRWLIAGSGALGVFLGGIISSFSETSLGVKLLISALATSFFVLLFWFVCFPFFSFEQMDETSTPQHL